MACLLPLVAIIPTYHIHQPNQTHSGKIPVISPGSKTRIVSAVPPMYRLFQKMSYSNFFLISVLDEMGSTYGFQNTGEKVKSDF